MQRMIRVRGIALLAAALVVCGATIARAQNAPAERARAENASAQPPASTRAFRLGTAARPFAWATAIGDLDADGRPDLAIADRIGRRGGGFAYSLELSIAGSGSHWVTFDAPDAALAITLLDVDHDHDLDVVVTAPISRAIVRVWLNDGHGRFREAPSTDVTTTRLGDSDGDAAPAGSAAPLPGTAPAHAGAAQANASCAFVPAAGGDSLRALDSRPARPLTSTQLQPRAPPGA
jgi:hypothetical protein